MERCRGKTVAALITAAFSALILVIVHGNFQAFSALVQAESLDSQTYSHVPIELLDENGAKIDPNAANAKPYSPRRTCGACHDYEAISKAYHFQLGADRISDDYGKKVGKPWISSQGQFGRQHHMSYAWVAKKRNSSADEIGMTPYQYSQTCGACHAGGGPMERDRDGQRYEQRQASHPEIADSFDGDYYKAAWDKSGVVEADCLMCHMQSYNAQARSDQLSKANFRWAATVGAGLGTVEGSVKDGQLPHLTYNRALFISDGKVALKITRPEDANCLLCHGEAEVKKRGHVWYDSRQSDVHTAAGMKCITCHSSGPDHQIRKGHSHNVYLHDELDDPTLSCEGCHLSPKSAKKPEHKSLPSSHLAKIACVTCHVREHNVAAVGAVDTTTGKALGLPTVPSAKKYGESGTWTPAYFRLEDGKIYSGNAILPVWWGNRVGEIIYPLHLDETARAFDRVKDVIKDDTGDGKPEANTEAEIKAMLASIAETLKGGRFKQVAPAFVKGDRVWEVVRGQLVCRPHPQASPLYWTFSHNVSPSSKAWGAKGCSDCHAPNSQFFYSPVIVDPFDDKGRQKSMPMWQYCRISKDVIEVGS
ncbi:MAG: hypothetical protein K6T99_12400 [Armatimonadetes bacterium]|nr:hypothetical protein [Armatimonadota bacterium]